MDDPDICADGDTPRNGDGNCFRLRGESGKKLKRGHLNRWWFQVEETAVFSQPMARAVTRSGQRFMKSLKLSVHQYRCQFFFAPEVIIESAFRRVYRGSDAGNARVHIADILK